MSQGFKLPIGGVADRRYRDMPSEEIYDELPPNAEFRIVVRGATEAGGAHGEGEDGESEEIFRSTSKRSANNDEAVVEPGVLVSVGVDLISPNDPRVKALADSNAPDMEQLDALRKSLRTESISRLPGTASAAFQQECLASDHSRIDWRELLRCWLYDRVLSDWRSFPFSRKHLVRGLYMPSIGVEAPGHIVFAIDTSGSMAGETLADIIGELRSFRETFPCRLTMIQCDASIQEIREFESMDGTEIPELLSIKGRGGTAFGPVFDWVAANVQGANLPVLIYATDGYGSFWKGKPEWPVIWLLTDEDVAVPHGQTVRV
jgi:predicted metal-dependent peptidase